MLRNNLKNNFIDCFASYTPWTPADTLVLAFYDMLQGVTDVGGGKISAWNDAIGNSLRDVTQANAANRPTLTNEGVVFNGTTDLLTNNAPFLYQHVSGVHIMAIISAPPNTLSASQRGISEASSISTNQNYSLLCKDNDTGNFGRTTQAIRNDANVDVIAYGGNAGTNTAWDNTFKLVEHIDTKTQIKTSINCIDSVTPINYTRTGTLTLDRFAIGAMRRSSSLAFMNMTLKGLAILPATVSEIDRQKMQGYLCHRYNLSNILPSNHPYKTTPPLK